MGDSSVPCPMIEERVKCLHGKLTQMGSQFANPV